MDYKHLTAYRKAKESIQDWIAKFNRLHSKDQNFSEFSKEKREGTVFFDWYKSEQEILGSFGSYKILETTYNDMFDDFEQYLEILDQPDEKSFFGSKKKRKLNGKAKSIRYNAKKLVEVLSMFGSVIGNLVTQNSDDELNEEERQSNVYIQEVDNDEITDAAVDEIIVENVATDTEEDVKEVEEIIKKVNEGEINEESDLNVTEEEITLETLDEDNLANTQVVEEYSDEATEKTEELTTKLEDEVENQEEIIEEVDDDEDENEEGNKKLEDEIELIRKKMEEEFQQRLKDLGL